MIGDKASTEKGLVELWHFQHDHPETDINPHLARTSPQFRHYIQRGLSKVDKRMGSSSGLHIAPVSVALLSLFAHNVQHSECLPTRYKLQSCASFCYSATVSLY